MGDVLQVDYAVLDGSRSSLEAIGRALEDAPRQREAIQAAVGHHGLADAVGDFADNWDRHRGALVDQIGTLAKTIADASATFHQADLDAGAAIGTGPATAPPGSPAPTGPTYGPPAPAGPTYGPPAPAAPTYGPPAPAAPSSPGARP